VIVRETSCTGNVLSGKRLSGKVIVRETSVKRPVSVYRSQVGVISKRLNVSSWFSNRGYYVIREFGGISKITVLSSVAFPNSELGLFPLFSPRHGDVEFAAAENRGVDLLAPDCKAEKCGTGNIGKSNVWKAKLIVRMLCDRQCRFR